MTYLMILPIARTTIPISQNLQIENAVLLKVGRQTDNTMSLAILIKYGY